MIFGKSYCFIRAASQPDAQRIYSGMHGNSRLAQKDGVLYLMYCDKFPATEADDAQTAWNGNLPDGLMLIEHFVDADEEIELLAHVKNDASVTCAPLKHRNVQHFGYEFRYGNNDVDVTAPLIERPIPSLCSSFWNRLNALLVANSNIQLDYGFNPDQLTVNTYEPGQGIPSHCDTHSPFKGPIVALSLGAGIVMEFRRPTTNRKRNIWLPPRSLLVLTGESRYGWTHAITPRHMDVVPNEAHGLTVRHRVSRRVSFTFRQLNDSVCPCECAFPELCDSRLVRKTDVVRKNSHSELAVDPKTDVISKDVHTMPTTSAAQLELENVHRVYDTIAGHFSDTRHSPWPKVLEFVNSLPAGSILADIGCGNGKYMLNYDQYRSPGSADIPQQQQQHDNGGILKLGGDRSFGLLNVCRERLLNVVRFDCLQVPLRDNCADACVCIAVVHHLATAERRLQALRELTRILRKGGRALVYVWAKNQAKDDCQSTYLQQNKRPTDVAGTMHKYVNGLPVHTNRTQFAAQDMLVPWKMRTSRGGVEPKNRTDESSAEMVENNNAKSAMECLRYYHVFEEGELESLIGQVTDVHMINSYYDQGNYCVIFEKD